MMKIDFLKNIDFDLVKVNYKSKVHSFSYYFPDAQCLKLNFKDINLPAGSYIEFYDEKRKYVHVAVFTKQKKYTLIMNANTANIKLVLPGNVEKNKKYSCKLISIEGELIDSLSVIYEDQRQPFRCFSGSAIYDNGLATAAIRLGAWGTGSLIGSGNFVLTNRHVVVEEANLANGEVWLNWFNETCAQPSPELEPVRLAADKLLAIGGSAGEEDYALFTLNDFDYRNSQIKTLFGGYQLSSSNPAVGDAIYIPQDGDGGLRPMYVSAVKGEDYAKILSVGSLLSYNADSQSGSSGSPVLSRDSNKLVGLHFAGGTTANYGVPVATLNTALGPIIGSANVSVLSAGTVASFNVDINPVQPTATISVDVGNSLGTHYGKIIPYDNVSVEYFDTYDIAQVESLNLLTNTTSTMKFKLEILTSSGPKSIAANGLVGVLPLRITFYSSAQALSSDTVVKSWLPLKASRVTAPIRGTPIIFVTRILYVYYDPFTPPFPIGSAQIVDFTINPSLNSSTTNLFTGAQFGYIALFEGQGPQALVWSADGYAVLRAVLRNSTGQQVIIHLRGQRQTGCTTRPLNAAVGCSDNANSSRMIISYSPADNAGVVLSSGFSGILPLQAQQWGNSANAINILLRIAIA